MLALFGPPETITAFVRNQRGQSAPAVDDDFLIIANYAASHTPPLPPSEPAAGTRLSGLRAVLGATCLSTHVDSEQPRFKVEGIRGSYEKRGTDPQENQLKAGWSPATNGDGFGVYNAARDPPAIRLGRLTTSIDTGSEPDGNGSGAVQQPKLATSDIPTLPGRYIDYWSNIGQSVRAAEDARQGSGSDEAAHVAVQGTLIVKPDQARDCCKLLNLARKSSVEGRTVKWTEDV